MGHVTKSIGFVLVGLVGMVVIALVIIYAASARCHRSRIALVFIRE